MWKCKFVVRDKAYAMEINKTSIKTGIVAAKNVILGILQNQKNLDSYP